MQHYLALSRNRFRDFAAHEDPELRRSLNQLTDKWDIVLSSDTLTIYSMPTADPAMHAHVLPNGGGVIFGCLFRTDHPGRVADVCELDSTRIVRSLGRELLENYWGSYVAILRSLDDRVLVIRDCSGRIPCYYVKFADHHIFFSDIRDMRFLRLRFTINRRYLASYILRSALHTRETALTEVSEVLAGDGVLLSTTSVTHKSFWNPRRIAAGVVGDDYEMARSALVSTTEQVIGAWASRYRRILLNLSGGIDSSVVLGCLKHIGAAGRVVCVHRYIANTDDDERAYARSAAAMAGVGLVERPRACDPVTFVNGLQAFPAAPKPDYTKALRLLSLDELRELAHQLQCDSVWTGQGGDHVFLQARDPWPAADYLLTHRLPYRLHTIMYDTAVLSRCSLWSILAQAVRYLWRSQTAPPDLFEAGGSAFLTPTALQELSPTDSAEPWLADSPPLPPGKQAQIGYFIDLLNRHEQLPAFAWPYECHPLISQPLVELSLRIPTYLLLKGGRQRAMAREAFADRVPSCILDREDKGSIRTQTRILLRGVGDLLRGELLQGALVSLRIVDPASLERIFVGGETYKAAHTPALLACLTAEMWARQWLS